MEINTVPESSYLGLRPLNRQEASHLIGREDDIRALLARLAETRFLAVTGAAGCGKSSLLQAGLSATLEAGYLAEDGIAWGVLAMRPGVSPLRNLAQMLLDAGVEVESADRQREPETSPIELLVGQFVSGGPLEFARLIQRNLTPDYQWQVVLMVDQFDDLFRYEVFAEPEEVKFFVELLLASARQEAVSITVVTAIDPAWRECCNRFPGLTEVIAAGQVDIAPALAEHWSQAGDFSQALARDAEAAYHALSPDHQRIAERLFRCVSESRARLPAMRRPVTLQDVANAIGAAATEVAAVVEELRAPPHYFLLPEEGIGVTPATLLDIRSDLLLRYWPRLREWMTQETEAARMYRHLEQAALRWRDKHANVWGALDLQQALEWHAREHPTRAWAARYGEHFDETLRFLLTSCQAQQARQQPARRHSFLWVVLLLIVGCLAFSGLAAWSAWQQRLARQERATAERARQKAELAQQRAEDARKRLEELQQPHTTELFESYLSQAAFLTKSEDYAAAQAILTHSRNFDLEVSVKRRHARNLLVWLSDVLGSKPEQTYIGLGMRLFDVAVSPDGKFLAAVGEQGVIVLFDAKSGALLIRLKSSTTDGGSAQSVNQVVFHPTGRWLATAGNDKQVVLWNVPEGSVLRQWHTSAEVWAVAVSPTGRLLATGGADAEIDLWNPDTQEHIRTFKGAKGAIHGIAFSPDSRLIASVGYDHMARVWDVSTGRLLRTLSGHTDKIFSVAFHPEGAFLATASADQTVRLWDTSSGKMIAIFDGHADMATGLAFVNGGRQLASGSFDRTLRIWDVPPVHSRAEMLIKGTTLRVLQGHDGGITRLIARDDQLFSSSNDGTVRRWNLRAAADRTMLFDLPTGLNTVAITPDGGHMAVGFADGALRLYHLPDLQIQWEKTAAHTDVITALAFTSDGTRLISGSFDRLVKVWKVNDGGLEQTFKGHIDGIESVAVAPDGKMIASASVDGEIGWFDLTKQQARFHLVPKNAPLHAVAFDASGQHVLSAGENGKTQIWNVSAWPFKLIREISASAEPVYALAISPDGQQLAVVGRDQRVHLFDAGDGREIRQFAGHTDAIVRVAFSPDGDQLFTVSRDATLRLWDLATGNPLFSLSLPTQSGSLKPLWTADIRCAGADCRVAVPLTSGKLAFYRLNGVYE